MKNALIKYSFYLLIVLFIGCDNSSDETIVPTVVVVNIQNLEEGGVEIIADFQNFSEEDELGFQVYSNEGSSEFVISNPVIGRNSIIIRSGLYQNRKYWTNAYIISGSGFYTSLTKEFYASSGSYIPEITSITPEYGYIGELVEINFSEPLESANIEDYTIKFHIKGAEIIEFIDNQKVIVRVPNFMPTNSYYRYPWAEMSMTYLGKVVPCDFVFKIKSPTIDSISPSFIDWGGEVIINGDFFKEGYTQNYVTIYLNNIPVTDVTHITSTEIRFEVSIHMMDNNPELKLSCNYRDAVETNTFSYYAPEITSFQQGTIGAEIEILGNYFWPASYVNEVYFDSYQAEIISGEPTRLVVKIPNGNYSNNQALLTIKTTDELVSEPAVYVID